jgi:hypothetical protein
VAVATEHLTQEEIRAELDRLARQKFSLSADEFLDRYEHNRLDLSSPSVARLSILARLLLQSPPRKRSRKRLLDRLLPSS